MNPVFEPKLALATQPETKTYAAFYDRHSTLNDILKALPGARGHVSLKQVHGNKVVSIDEAAAHDLTLRNASSVNLFKADACVTRARGLLLSVHTADCVPLLAAAKGGIIGACHAGWRGVNLGIVENFIGALGTLGALKTGIKIAMGPAIGPCHFEVKKDVTALLVTQAIPASVVKAIKRPHPDPEKDFIDLRELVRYKLLRLGLNDQNIIKSVDCTHCDETRFFSYRRDGAQKGRLEGVIVNQL